MYVYSIKASGQPSYNTLGYSDSTIYTVESDYLLDLTGGDPLVNFGNMLWLPRHTIVSIKMEKK